MKNENYEKALESFTLPTYTEIPDVGLYLEQVVKYINGFFSDFTEMQITSSMISNYVKSKMISNPHKKMYNRDQIAQLFFIIIAKNVLSMDYIRICLQDSPLFSNTEEGYTYFRENLLSVVHSFFTSPLTLSQKDTEEETAVSNIVIAVAHKMYLEKYFDQLHSTSEATGN